MAWILRRLPGAGLLREAWHATQLQGAIHEKKRAERAIILAEQNAQIGEFYILKYLVHRYTYYYRNQNLG